MKTGFIFRIVDQGFSSAADAWKVKVDIISADRIDAAKKIAESIGSKWAAEYLKMAQRVKEITGGTVYYGNRHGGTIAITLSASASYTDMQYSGAWIDCEMNEHLIRFLGKLQKAMGVSSYIDVKLEKLVETLINLGAQPAKYCSEISEYVPDEAPTLPTLEGRKSVA